MKFAATLTLLASLVAAAPAPVVDRRGGGPYNIVLQSHSSVNTTVHEIANKRLRTTLKYSQHLPVEHRRALQEEIVSHAKRFDVPLTSYMGRSYTAPISFG
jgi:hypothetical protein